ncbi:MAG: MFS transporter, partial [Actinomycetota bacterium]
MDEPARQTYRVYRYRWVVLAATMGVNLTIQMLWISYAPITDDATRYYGVSTLAIGLLSMVFMIAFIPLSLPASWLIDRRGFRVAVGFGSVLMGVSGIVRGLAGDDYTLALLSTIAIACAQPFLMNAWTTVPAKWFPETERATAVGLVTLASLVGTGVGMALTPVLATSTSIASIQLLYGGLAAAAAAAFLLLAREQPATPPSTAGADARALVLDELKHALTVRPFLLYLAVIFVGMGIFNGVTTWV